MPICYGKLQMTGEEIAAATPWEITHRIDGYVDRMKDKIGRASCRERG